MKKCSICRSTEFMYLIWDWSTQNMKFMMLRDLRHKMKKKLLELINAAHYRQIVKVSDFASLIGDLNFFRF